MSSLTDLVVWGARGHAKVLHEFVGRIGFRLVAVFDNDPEVPPPFPDIPLHVGSAGFARVCDRLRPGTRGLVAIGGPRGTVRLEIQSFLADHGIGPATAVHPTAFVASDARIGAGSQILAQAALCADARIGRACILNTGCSVDHECELGDGVHVAPGATIAGSARIGDFSFIGPGAVVTSFTTIGPGTVVGAGSVVCRDLPGGVVAYGVPARIIRPAATVGS